MRGTTSYQKEVVPINESAFFSGNRTENSCDTFSTHESSISSINGTGNSCEILTNQKETRGGGFICAQKPNGANVSIFDKS
eukprot:snap_masked-scaffold_8-processed-gene-13.26-mRNA-1 protein AED:1.00 eAED:1.00 QI:0/0/0/0/1/1/2/0/80